MNKDRGTIKWTSMMLPEHVKLLREWADQDEYDTMPEADEQQKEEWGRLIQEALELKLELSVSYFKDHRIITAEGLIEKVDDYSQMLTINGVQISFHTLVAISQK
ncbi:YolD-like family protein [Jeotgalibacillus sp. R-1-5s-1]|uniref:YolD-like family protein n=1 Tax=Jeotgalibacillus sp. R-1-5s-1 TaxID=2555897 RepID=UPI00106DA0C2|nr:YolD-like family protein [Jeotgalibacillus sp. R-1-5s-1]TFD92208.1 YolD-like family protein [Jeotgalibacillus sp. R-1-5s-1]